MNYPLYILMCRNIAAFRTLNLLQYWFKFDLTLDKPHPIGSLLGCGVTAFDYDDAVAILKQIVFVGHPFPKMIYVIKDVKFEQIDQNHVRPNMAVMLVRGVWYPLGHEDD